jgi:hypothetical protein
MFGGADTVRVLGRNILVDELVPNPPRSTTSNWVRDLSAASGSPLSDPLSVYASSADGMEPEEVEALQPVPAFARAPNALASAYNGTMAFGVGPAGQMLWSATAQFRKGWVWGTLTHDHLWCIAENSPALQVRCFLTR